MAMTLSRPITVVGRLVPGPSATTRKWAVGVISWGAPASRSIATEATNCTPVRATISVVGCFQVRWSALAAQDRVPDLLVGELAGVRLRGDTEPSVSNVLHDVKLVARCNNSALDYTRLGSLLPRVRQPG